jgi:two-component system sensor histidine kinase/response regulator
MAKILVVENDSALRTLVTQLLELEGHTVVAAENGAVALDFIKNELPDLVLCDLLMPEVDGHQVLQRLTENPVTASIPLIFLTASALPSDRELCLKNGAKGFMTKPFHHLELLDLISNLLPKPNVSIPSQ